jgi:hypothetical protein
MNQSRSSQFRTRNSGNSGYNKTEKKYCKVCHDAGKPESEYTNHFVRSVPGPKGIVVCPTLLNTECRYCFNYGHTSKFCPKLQEKNKMFNKEKKIQEEKPIKRREFEPSKNKGGSYSILVDSDSDDDTEKKVRFENFPSLTAKCVTSTGGNSYISALKKSQTQVDREQEEKSFEAGWAVLKLPSAEKLKPNKDSNPKKKIDFRVPGAWTAESSDEESDDEEENDIPTRANTSFAVAQI